MTKRVLFLSNGHGEDLNATLIVRALHAIDPSVDVAAMPIVGTGDAYRKLAVPIIGPTQQLPSGGFNYINVVRLFNPVNWWRDTNPVSLIRDLFSGLIGLTWRQIQAVRRYGRTCDLLFATGDIVPILFAYVTRRPFIAFLVSTSSYYEGRVKLPWLAQMGLRSRRCCAVLTRDAFTAKDLLRRGFPHARYAGYPIMDVLTPTGADLNLDSTRPMIALLPGSRLPEAQQNLGLMLQLCEAITARCAAQFHVALVPSFAPQHLQALAIAQGWQMPTDDRLCRGDTTVHLHYDAFADILHQCTAVVGMAGTAVEQAVGLGKPVVQIPGPGPQFTYLFAEAQMRLLGPSVTTIGCRPATPAILQKAAQHLCQILGDRDYQAQCVLNGQERVGLPGGSTTIAQTLIDTLKHLSSDDSRS